MKNGEIIMEEGHFLSIFPECKPLFDFFKNKIKIRKEKGGTKDFYWLTLETRCSMRYEVRINACDDGSVYFGGWSHNREERPFEDWHIDYQNAYLARLIKELRMRGRKVFAL